MSLLKVNNCMLDHFPVTCCLEMLTPQLLLPSPELCPTLVPMILQPWVAKMKWVLSPVICLFLWKKRCVLSRHSRRARGVQVDGVFTVLLLFVTFAGRKFVDGEN